MFGYYDIPLEIVKEGISLSLERAGADFIYKSECADTKVEKLLLARTGKVLINPVEPLHKPKELTSALLIEFDKNLVVEPGTTRKIFVTYPIEIGVLVSTKTHVEVLDILTLVRQKFTLYGDPRSGVICKYWRSNVYSSTPSVDPLHEGVMELTIINTTAEWVAVTKAVFNAYGMKIYYNDDLVAMKASLKIAPRQLSETGFVDAPLKTGMMKSLELYTARKIAITTTKFVMEAGL